MEISETGFAVVQQAAGQQQTSEPPKPEKNLAAVTLGKLGGSKGSGVRAVKLWLWATRLLMN